MTVNDGGGDGVCKIKFFSNEGQPGSFPASRVGGLSLI